MSALITKHRPKAFAQVVGQEQTIKALTRVLEQGTSQQFMFHGYFGCGKTTLARIAATMLGCAPGDIMEHDAATFSGIDKMRELTAVMKYRPVGGGEKRAIILDECHGLSKQAWDSLLKSLEEPNEFVLWFFCTTNIAKVPKTALSRCTQFAIKPMNEQALEKVIARVAKREGMEITPGVMQVLAREAQGSARQALSNLATAGGATTAKEAERLLHVASESDPVMRLCRFLMQPGSWPVAMGIVAQLEDENPEGIRIIVSRYFASVIKGAKSNDKAGYALGVLDAFASPYNSAEGFAPLLLSIGRVMLGE